MNEQKKPILNIDQARLVAEISATYGTEPEDILFFTADPNPFFGFETSCVMLNRLHKPKSLHVEPVDSISPDSVSHNCNIIFADGSNFGNVGVVNRGETDGSGNAMNDQQLAYLASSRALRSTLRLAGIDLLKLHQAATNGLPELQFTGIGKSNRSVLMANAHALGEEIGLIAGDDKTIWYRLLSKRYKAGSSRLLTDPELADWVAYLRTLTVQPEIQRATA